MYKYTQFGISTLSTERRRVCGKAHGVVRSVETCLRTSTSRCVPFLTLFSSFLSTSLVENFQTLKSGGQCFNVHLQLTHKSSVVGWISVPGNSALGIYPLLCPVNRSICVSDSLLKEFAASSCSSHAVVPTPTPTPITVVWLAWLDGWRDALSVSQGQRSHIDFASFLYSEWLGGT